ncbi:MAG: alternative ribosome rescue aminoacyl-tRNA hydrolase ArfB [Planctomycetota bacterium]|nr:alternative ribosome rescue aminoacyl-tRNA hydrolase ArfB [Planctomycetota bacterium]
MIQISRSLRIPDSELRLEYSRSTGPGGQNVNKLETRVTILFDVEGSPSLSETQRDRIHATLRTRITKKGILRVTSQRHRTQAANRNAAMERFIDLLRDAIKPVRKRKPTKPTRASNQRRLDSKKKRGESKRDRGGRWEG